MKFKTKTKMQTATWRDLEMADAQGSILSVHVPGFTSDSYYRSTNSAYQEGQDTSRFMTASIMLGIISVLFGGALYRYFAFSQEYKYGGMKEPLVSNEAQLIVADDYSGRGELA
jgi:hypothetical protein